MRKHANGKTRERLPCRQVLARAGYHATSQFPELGLQVRRHQPPAQKRHMLLGKRLFFTMRPAVVDKGSARVILVITLCSRPVTILSDTWCLWASHLVTRSCRSGQWYVGRLRQRRPGKDLSVDCGPACAANKGHPTFFEGQAQQLRASASTFGTKAADVSYPSVGASSLQSLTTDEMSVEGLRVLS